MVGLGASVTFAGTGSYGSVDGSLVTAHFGLVVDMVVTANGKMFIAESTALRKISEGTLTMNSLFNKNFLACCGYP